MCENGDCVCVCVCVRERESRQRVCTCVSLHVGMRVHITMSLLRKVYNEHLFNRLRRRRLSVALSSVFHSSGLPLAPVKKNHNV